MRPALAAFSGALAGCTALAVAELVSVGVRPQAGPVVAVGGAAIDRTPPAVKDWAIRNFGTDDKLVLQLGILVVLALLALALGLLALRHIRSAAAGVLLFGVVGGLAATGRPDSAGITDALPSLAGAAAGAATLFLLVSRLTATRTETGAETGESGAGHEPGWDRRAFVITAVTAAAASTGAGTLGRHLNGSAARDAVASRKDVV
ncbi:molybdopterin-binding oxidoreductase, partial [Streptomyces sp. WAC 01325]